jgi:hypothetical protein
MCLASLSVLSGLAAAQQLESGVVLVDAPVRIYPDVNRVPLATLTPGTSVQILEQRGEWLRISFRDKTLGDRVGFVRAEHVRTARQNQPATPPAPNERTQPTVSSPVTATDKPTPNNEIRATAPQPALDAAPAVMPATSTTPESRTASTITARQPRQFPNAQLTIAEGEKTKQVDVTVSYTADTFQLLDKDTRKALKEFAYKSFVGGEYSYSKAPRWKSGVFISPFLFLSSGKKHWLLVKATDDYVMLRLDKVNYKLIIAEWETRTGLKVEAQGENK